MDDIVVPPFFFSLLLWGSPVDFLFDPQLISFNALPFYHVGVIRLFNLFQGRIRSLPPLTKPKKPLPLGALSPARFQRPCTGGFFFLTNARAGGPPRCRSRQAGPPFLNFPFPAKEKRVNAPLFSSVSPLEEAELGLSPLVLIRNVPPSSPSSHSTEKRIREQWPLPAPYLPTLEAEINIPPPPPPPGHETEALVDLPFPQGQRDKGTLPFTTHCRKKSRLFFSPPAGKKTAKNVFPLLLPWSCETASAPTPFLLPP